MKVVVMLLKSLIKQVQLSAPVDKQIRVLLKSCLIERRGSKNASGYYVIEKK